ncbi:Uncharacterized protein OBRU01_09478, partial [Operophtera brumata]
MGQTLSEPVTEKQSATCQDSRYLVGSSCMQGWRGFLDMDQAMLEKDMLQEKVAGSTAVVVLVKENTLYCANEVISFCRVRLLSGWEPAAVCEALMHRCLAPNCATGGLGCDNMTVLIICLAPFPRNQAVSTLKIG